MRQLAREIYPERWKETDVALGRFVDPVLELQASAVLEDDEAFIVFRGSVGPFGLSSNWRNVNFHAILNSEDPPRHAGFAKAWRALRGYVVKWLDVNQPKSISIAGDSLGAALPQLAAFDLCKDWAVARVVVFASPMIGHGRFNNEYATKPVYGGQAPLGERTIRYLLLTDAISNPIPKFFKYEPFPVVSIDEYGRNVRSLRGFFSRIVGVLTLEKKSQSGRSLSSSRPRW